jgi:uncharacterized protein (TIGR00299 family) protein
MTLGALVSAGADATAVREQLAQLDLPGYEISFEQVDRSGIDATRAIVRATRKEQHHRHLKDILGIIGDSRLGESVKERAAKIFTRLAEAEARVHGVEAERIHFHEVGAVDSIVDVVGACIGFELLGIERFAASALHVGSGTVEMAHGRFPVPPPAVAELLRGAPIYSTDIVGELVTPTGAAIVGALCEGFGAIPRMRLLSTGYGAGTREYKGFPNVLRVLVGEAETGGEAALTPEVLTVLESNIDDVSPQVLGHLMEQAFACGALDCYFTHVQMKKNRPGVLVSILCRSPEREALCELLFTETTTLGVRRHEVERLALEREFVTVQTEFGAIALKTARLRGRVLGGTPEFEQCREAALRAGVPLRVVQEAAQAAFRQSRV